MHIDEHVTELPATRARISAGWPPMLPTFATLVAVAIFVAAGNWQRARMDAKESLRAQLDAAAANAPAPLPRHVIDWTAWRFRPVTATGTFDTGHQILIDNKVHEGIVGFDVVTPLRLNDGRIVLVDRGFVPAGPSRQMLPTVTPPYGSVTVRGRINLPATTYFELGHEAPAGPLWQHLDVRRYAEATGLSVQPVVIEATLPTGGDDALARDWPAPDLGIERHRIYMVQWYAFAAMALAFWAWFVLRPRLFQS
jgi:surfeit locus 1 family protein